MYFLTDIDSVSFLTRKKSILCSEYGYKYMLNFYKRKCTKTKLASNLMDINEFRHKFRKKDQCKCKLYKWEYKHML